MPNGSRDKTCAKYRAEVVTRTKVQKLQQIFNLTHAALLRRFQYIRSVESVVVNLISWLHQVTEFSFSYFFLHFCLDTTSTFEVENETCVGYRAEVLARSNIRSKKLQQIFNRTQAALSRRIISIHFSFFFSRECV